MMICLFLPLLSPITQRRRPTDRDYNMYLRRCSCLSTYLDAPRLTSSSMHPGPSHAWRMPFGSDRENRMSLRGCSWSTTYADAPLLMFSSMLPLPSQTTWRHPLPDQERGMSLRGCSWSSTDADASDPRSSFVLLSETS